MSTWNRHVVLPSSKRVDDSPTTKVQEKREPAEEVKNEEEEIKNEEEVQNEVVVVVKNEEEEIKNEEEVENEVVVVVKNEEEEIKNEEEVKNEEEEVKNEVLLSEFHLTAITLITTVTFAVSLQVPGGYNSTGKAVLSENNNFKYFLIFDSLAFGTSAGLMLMHLIIRMAPSSWFGRVLSLTKPLTIPLIGISVIEMILAFWSGLKSVLDEKSTFTSAINKCIFISFAFPFFFSFLFCLLIISIFILFIPLVVVEFMILMIQHMKRLRGFMEGLILRGSKHLYIFNK